MDMKKLAKDLLSIAEAAAPLVGLSEEVEAGRNLVATVKNVIESNKVAFASDDQAALQLSLDALVAKVNAHADRTIDRLKGE